MSVDLVLNNVNLVTVTGDETQSVIRNGHIVVEQGKILALGSGTYNSDDSQDAEGAWLLPGLIDCHTHLVYAGDRSHEHEQRKQGKTYQQIAAEGGGIMFTVRETRKASEAELISLAETRLRQLVSEGVTAVEIKSGYGLDVETELKMLRVARKVAEKVGVRVSTTFLGAHCVPTGIGSDEYIDYVCDVMLPEVVDAGLADSVDAFCETVGFSYSQTKKVLMLGGELGLSMKLHADQLTNTESAGLVAELGGLSADHVEYTSFESCEKMARAGTVAVLLPGAFVTLKETQKPPIEAFRSLGIPMAVSTDSNPGTSPYTSIQQMMRWSQEVFGLSNWETIQGVTCHASRALGWQKQRGKLEIGMDADLALFESNDFSKPNRCLGSWVAGQRLL